MQRAIGGDARMVGYCVSRIAQTIAWNGGPHRKGDVSYLPANMHEQRPCCALMHAAQQ